MRLLDPIDLYCERTTALLWAEPVNALSNLGFLLAAWLLLSGMDARTRATCARSPG